jgi:hypothetical protein
VDRPDPPADPYAALADESRAADAAQRRAQTRWLHQQLAEEATLASTLVDLAESGSLVSVRSRSGRQYRGAVQSVGGDFAVVGDAWIRLDAIVAVRSDPTRRAGAAAGERASTRPTRLVDALADIAPDRPTIVVVPVGGEPLRGELRAVGLDVVTLTLDGDPDSRCYVALDALAEVLVAG